MFPVPARYLSAGDMKRRCEGLSLFLQKYRLRRLKTKTQKRIMVSAESFTRCFQPVKREVVFLLDFIYLNQG